MRHQLIFEILMAVKERYKSADRKSKTEILNGMCKDFKRSRKGLIRLINRSSAKPYRAGSGRPPVYDDEVVWWLQSLWTCMGHMNSKAMAASLPQWLRFNPDPNFPASVRVKILRMAPSTIDRLLSGYKKQIRRKARSGTKPPIGLHRFKHSIPIKNFDQKIDKAGFMEADTVAHCGNSLAGEFAWTLNMTDHKTAWCEQRAVWHKQDTLILDAIRDIQRALPFKLAGIHTDCGSEFLNHAVAGTFSKPESDVIFTHGRPYKKNDQARIEQKNFTHVRRLVGYDRIDDPHAIILLQDIYKNEHRLLMNFFTPQAKMISKTRVGAKYRRKYDTPKTPFERVLHCREIPEHAKQQLKEFYETLNPFVLQESLNIKIKRLENLLKKKPSSSDPNQNPTSIAA